MFDPVDAVAIGEEHHVQLPSLDQLRELDPAIDVESGIDHRIRMPPSPGVTTGRRHEYGQFQHRIPSAWLAAPWQLSAKCPHPGGGVNGERRRSGLIRSRDNTGEPAAPGAHRRNLGSVALRSEEHTSELQSLMRISYAVFCLKKKH